MSQHLEVELESAIGEYLEKLRAKLTAQLATIANSQRGSDTHLLSFQYDSPEFTNHFAVGLWRMDIRGNPDEGLWLLRDEPCTIPSDILDDPRYVAADIETWEIASTLFEHWFADCWRWGGGNDQPIPAYLSHHDSYFYFELRRRRTLKEPELGFQV